MSSELTMTWLVALVNIALVLFAAYAAAQLTWRFIPDSEASISTPQLATTIKTAANAVDGGIDANRLVSYHLFGQANKRTQVEQGASVVRATRLPLTLRGLVASDRPDTARAIIVAPNAGELPYAIGATLPGNARLEEIHTDKIILSRNGQLETLLMEKDSDGVDFSVVPMPASVDVGASADEVIATPDQFRDALLHEPESIAGLVNTVPQTDDEGRLIGFQLQPGRDAGFLQRFGMEPGDVLTSVNGIQLDSPVRALEVMRELGEAGQVRVEVLRNGVPQSLVFSFDQ